VRSTARRIADTDLAVLILGENGTGKEVVARAIHFGSRRRKHPFIAVNCAALTETLLESELFGHEKGAFTGAVQRQLGRFELADSGTIFFDEIGELPVATQVTLLRVLQEREFERVGGGQSIPVDVRVIAATNRDLKAAVAEGAFRSDLFYRLDVFPVRVPPLRERPDDIPLLVAGFVQRLSRNVGRKIRSVTRASLDLLLSYTWPGNIRELQNVIERAVIVSDSEILAVDERWLRDEVAGDAPSHPSLAETLTVAQKTQIEAALAETRGRVSGPIGAAAKLGVHPSTLESKIRSLRIDKNVFKRPY